MLASRLLQRLNTKKARLDTLRPLPATALRRIEHQLALEWTYNSNAIEGNTLTLRETSLIVETGLTIGGKSLREHLEVVNHQSAIAYVSELAATTTTITAFHVRQIHALIMQGIDTGSAGTYRTINVRITGATHIPPEPWEAPRLMDDWQSWLQSSVQEYHPVERAAIAHHRLAAIHPFVDGNGRTARLVMNVLLLQNGYPPAIIERTNRRQYYRALALADTGQPSALVNLVGRALERTMNVYLEAATPQPQPPAPDEEWIRLRDAAAYTSYSQEYLSLMARTGRIEAIKRGHMWYTTRRALAAYRASVAPEEQ